MENSSRASYKELTRLVRQQGLLDRQPAYYAGNVVVILGLLASFDQLVYLNQPFLFHP